MKRTRLLLIAASSLSAIVIGVVACGGGDDNSGDDSTTDSGGPDTTTGDSGPPADTGTPETGPFCNTTPCATAIGVGGAHSCAVISDGTVRCWGGNMFGALGSGTAVDGGTFTPVMSATPLVVGGLSNAVSVSGGGQYAGDIGYTCAVLASKSLDCWGFNQLGELGRADAAIPADITPQSTLLTNAVDVSANLYAVCSTLSSGDVACWGVNAIGQIVQPIDSKIYPQPTIVNAGGTKFTQVSVGLYNACAITNDAHVWCWGFDAAGDNGHFTDGGDQDQTPAEVPGVDSAISVASGYLAACAVKSDGSLLCWGLNAVDMLGRGAQPDGGPPQDPNALPVAAPAGTKFKQVVARAVGFCALATDGSVWCWGDNTYGAAGSGTADAGNAVPGHFDVPTQIAGLSDVIQLASMGYGFHTCALINGGAVKCWGFNLFEQLGVPLVDGGDVFSITPVTVTF